MNSDVFYRRHAMPPKPKPIETPPADVSPLAVHGDPSQSAQQTAEQHREGSVRWVRPSEMPSMVANRYVRRLADANTAAVRQTRQLPRRAIARMRIAGTIDRTSPGQGHEEGIGR